MRIFELGPTKPFKPLKNIQPQTPAQAMIAARKREVETAKRALQTEKDTQRRRKELERQRKASQRGS